MIPRHKQNPAARCLSALLLAACAVLTPPTLCAQTPVTANTASRTANISKLFEQARDEFNKRRFEQALPIYRKALAMAKESGDSAAQADLLGSIGACLEQLGRYREALDYYLQARALRPKDEDYAADIDVARGYHLTGDYAKAAPLFEHKYQLALRHGEPGVVDTVLTAYTEFLVAADQPSKALQVAQHGQSYWIKMGYSRGSTESQAAVVKLLLSLNLYAKALALAELTLQQREDIRESGRYYVKPPPDPVYGNDLPVDSTDFAESLTLVAEAHRGLRNVAKALAFHQRGLAMREKVHPVDHPLIAQSLNDIADVMRDSGKLDEARSFAKRALAMREKMLGTEHPQVAQSLLTLARISQDSGNPAETLQFVHRALSIREKVLGNEHPFLAPDVTLLATLHATLNDADAAGLNRRASALRAKARRPPPAALERLLMGALYPPPHKAASRYLEDGMSAMGRDQYERALDYFKKGLAAIDRTPRAGAFARMPHYEQMAQALESLKRYPEAAKTQQLVIEAYDRGGKPNHAELIKHCYRLGRYYEAAGAREPALKAYTRAATLGEKLAPEDLQTAETLRALGAMHEAMGDIPKAIPVYQRSLAIAAKILPATDKTLLTMRARVTQLQHPATASPR
jgi:tetratricopeptide (TPR) repeat protein